MSEHPINILIVDDDVHVLSTLKAIVNEFKMHALLAENVPEAIELLKNNAIELILTDLIMPDIDGLKFIEIVKANYPSIPIAVISAYGIIANTVSALNKGAFSFITKPFSLEDIRAVIEKGLRLRHLSLNTDELLQYMENKTELALPGKRDLFQAVVYFMMKECQWRGFEQDSLLANIAICLEEMLTNALVHGHEGDEEKIIKVSAKFVGDKLFITVTDNGGGFDHKSFCKAIDEGDPVTLKKKGLFIIKNIVKELVFNESGNEITVMFNKA